MGEEQTFWDHLEALRGTVFRSLLGVLVATIAVFCFKEFVFDKIVFAPTRADFILYRLLGLDFSMDLINVNLSAQFFVHLRISATVGFIVAFPYIAWEIWKFLAPALYDKEKKIVKGAFGVASILFYIGLVVGYILILPITLNFFQGYTVSDSVENMISLDSYISTFSSMVLLFGIVFEFPAVILVLSHFGIIYKEHLRKYRRHAIIVILIVSAIITPADPFSMIIAALPLYLLYEGSVLVCKSRPKDDYDFDEDDTEGEVQNA